MKKKKKMKNEKKKKGAEIKLFWATAHLKYGYCVTIQALYCDMVVLECSVARKRRLYCNRRFVLQLRWAGKLYCRVENCIAIQLVYCE